VPSGLRERVQGGVVDPHLAGAGSVDAGDHVQQGGLAAARFADDADKFPRFEPQVDALSTWYAPAAVW